MMTSITLEGITKAFPRAGTVVDSLSLVIERGEFFTLLGPSGCGKSTLLRLIGGFEAPTSGRILLGDRDVTHEPPNRRGIGFVFQNYALFPHLSVAENVAFGLQVRKIARTEVAERVRETLEQVRLADCSGERVERLSGGQQQRLALARALVVRPRVLLLDEPLSNLDATLRHEARALLRTIHRTNGATIIYVTHDQAEAMAVSDRVGILCGGRLLQAGAPRAIYQQPATKFVADFMGRNNVLDVSVSGTSGARPIVRFVDGTEMTVDPERRAQGVDIRAGARLGVCVRPESIRIARDGGTFQGVVTGVEYAGPTTLCEVRTALGTLHVDVPNSHRSPTTGDYVRLAIPESTLHLIGMEVSL
jgi:iron(III) transport system ATP-binding protein